MRCPSCNSYMNSRMDYNFGNPMIIYTCDNCKYTTFGESYIASNKTTMTTGSSMTTSSTQTRYEPSYSVKKSNRASVYTPST